MSYYLIAEEGPLKGLKIDLTDEERVIVGRDPDSSTCLIEDPSISRRHALFLFNEDGIEIENLSLTNPLRVNGNLIEGKETIVDGDFISLGANTFRFVKKEDSESENGPKLADEFLSKEAPLFQFSMQGQQTGRFYLKVISGPNSGAEFPLIEGESLVLGKDEGACDVAFNDLSVSKRHARLSFNSANIPVIEDLESLNKIFVNHRRIEGQYELKGQDLISLGTTQLILIDKEMIEETVFNPFFEEKPIDTDTKEGREMAFKKMVIPYKHLVGFGALAFVVIVSTFFLLSLFSSHEIPVSFSKQKDEVASVLKRYPKIEYTFNPPTGKLFLVGHVLNEVEYEEMLFLLNQLPFLKNVEDTVVIDELVWQNANALIQTNPNWKGILIQAIAPAEFVLRGYLETIDQQAELLEYIALNFTYLNQLKNELVINALIQQRVQSILTRSGFGTVSFNYSMGELVLSGPVEKGQERTFKKIVDQITEIKGVENVESIITYTSESSARIDISSKYQVNGSSIKDGIEAFVLINGRILSKGKMLDGMLITAITSKEILLEKDGVKYKIDFNS
ncbi:MAG: EscD/YscD/HrpQ family type III secretion system inner membrane ring protein [Chlamydiae bacterium]|nr:EscD/YscD/HrpQ family type III secretion system inner membrane ring protein [Chlamydiota bacterium]